MLNIIGLGLRGSKSITMEALDVIRSCDIIYFESYTSISPDSTLDELKKLFKKEIREADRELVESETRIIAESSKHEVALLVTGDPLTATTHNQLRFDALEKGVEVKVYENSSIVSVLPGFLGLMHYRFGPPVSIPFVSESFFPISIYDKIEKNISMEMHTLLLLDLRGGRTMPVQEALRILEELERKRKRGVLEADKDICVAIGVGHKNQKIVFGTIGSIKKSGLDGSPAVIIIPSSLNDTEEIFLNRFAEKS